MEYEDHVRALTNDHPALARELASFTGISSLLNWMQKRGLARAPVDMIAQDEFEYDFLIQFEPAGRWLAFGVT